MVLGSLAHTAMFALVASLLVPYGPVGAYVWAALGALAVNGLALAVARRTAPRSPSNTVSPKARAQ